jgi:hypothetical protein
MLPYLLPIPNPSDPMPVVSNGSGTHRFIPTTVRHVTDGMWTDYEFRDTSEMSSRIRGSWPVVFLQWPAHRGKNRPINDCGRRAVHKNCTAALHFRSFETRKILADYVFQQNTTPCKVGPKAFAQIRFSSPVQIVVYGHRVYASCYITSIVLFTTHDIYVLVVIILRMEMCYYVLFK